MSSDTWSTPVIVIPPADVSRVALCCPPVRRKHFPHLGRMHAWIDKFEQSLAHSHDAYTKHKPELDILRQTINGELPEYSATGDINAIIDDIIRVWRGCVRTAALPPAALPHDAVVQFFPPGSQRACPEQEISSLNEDVLAASLAGAHRRKHPKARNAPPRLLPRRRCRWKR